MGGAAEFNPACPDGSYQLDLAAPADRAVAHQLAALDVQSGQDLMRDVTLDGRHVSSCRKSGWPERLPTKGALSCDFVSRWLKRDVPIIDSRKFNNLVKQVTGRQAQLGERPDPLAAGAATAAAATCTRPTALLHPARASIPSMIAYSSPTCPHLAPCPRSSASLASVRRTSWPCWSWLRLSPTSPASR
jgi:hypothetical protein